MFSDVNSLTVTDVWSIPTLSATINSLMLISLFFIFHLSVSVADLLFNLPKSNGGNNDIMNATLS